MKASDLIVHPEGPAAGDGGVRGEGHRVDSARAHGPVLADAMAHPGPSIVDVPVDYKNAKLTAGARPAHLSDLSPA
jgi:hypothetical protein